MKISLHVVVINTVRVLNRHTQISNTLVFLEEVAILCYIYVSVNTHTWNHKALMRSLQITVGCSIPPVGAGNRCKNDNRHS